MEAVFALPALRRVEWNHMVAGLEGGDTGADLDGDAVVLSLGGRYRTAAGWAFDFGFSEDLRVDASPDIVFLLGVRREF